jgi:hypothetical protein
MRPLIHSQELLPIGTPVRIKNSAGVVVAAQLEPAIPYGMIACHTVEITRKGQRGFGSFIRWDSCVPTRKEANYAFIRVLEKLP